jgi:hypothetical protein
VTLDRDSIGVAEVLAHAELRLTRDPAGYAVVRAGIPLRPDPGRGGK